jgi:hypothetical protein
MRISLPTTVKAAKGVLPIVLLAALATAALAAYGMGAVRAGWGPAGMLRVNPADRTVAPGGVAVYRIVIDPKLSWAPIGLRVLGLPGRTRARLTFARNRSVATLVITTSSATRTGTYRVRLRTVGGFSGRSASLWLSVRAPRAVPIQMSGGVSGLEPGSLQALNLVLRNPNPVPISVTSMSASLERVTAPHASSAHPCGPGDFYIRQYAGPYPLLLPARGSRTLSGLGITTILQPQIVLLNRPVDQDGCQGATVTLGYSGTAVSR